MNRLILTWFVSIFVSTAAYCSFYKEYSLVEGESIIIEVPTESGLKLPRSKVIDVQYIHHDQWRIIALKKGNVTLRPIDKLEKDEVAVLVKVRKPDKQKKLDILEHSITNQRVFKIELVVQKLSFVEDDLHGIEANLGNFGKSKVASRSMANNGEVLSRTSVDLRQSSKAKITDGGEFLVQYDSAKKEEEVRGWKAYGMVGEIFLETVSKKNAALKFNIKLSSQSQGSSNIQRHSFSGSTKLIMDKFKCLGTSFLDSSSNNKVSHYYLSTVPIIGPLFQLMQEQTIKTQVQLWSKISIDK